MSDLKAPLFVAVVALVIVLAAGCASAVYDSYPQPPASCTMTELQKGHVFLIICNEE